MAGEIQLNSTSFASESGGTITINNATVGSAVAMSANQACVKTALNASGSAPIYACRAWANFNGTGTVSIRNSGNVSSITDNGGGDYQVNFGTSMPHANYSTLITNTSFATNSTQRNSGIKGSASSSVTTYTTSSVGIIVGNPSSASLEDNVMMCVAVFC